MRTLQPDSRIAHYRIVGPLGAGGMGEVYLAQDEKLERKVALKILPPELVKSEDRVRRFLLEARSASSLNHPHIVTVYEVGHDVVRASDDSEEASTGAEPVHYIAMELVSGKTLHDLVYNDSTDLRTLLGYLAQAAEGVSKAHAAGIVHRDLKPGNIMVTGDGYAKVLDFGLAKLTERGVAQDEATQAPTEAAMTGGGVVLGTVGYMAPEQIKGQSVDHRADVFAFGCMLYEAATRQRPFVADSHIETMHKILHDKPPPIREVNAEVPSELRRLIRRCLAKNPDQRLQSIKDLALELREVVDEYDELSATATSGSTIEAPQIAPELRRRPGLAALVGAAVIIGLVGAAFGVWVLLENRGGGASEDAPFTNTRMSVLMSDANVFDAALSADGRFLAYLKGPTGQWSLWVRQVATGSDVQVLKPQSTPLRGISFSPDGNYLYYLGRDPETPLYSALFEVPSLGGSARKRLFDVDTALAFSPDGKQAAFVRGLPPPEDASALMIVDLTTGQEKTLATVSSPRDLPFLRPAWSPDGSSIAAVVASQDRGYRASIVAFDAADGSESSILEGNRYISSIAWLQDGSGLVATGPRGAGSRQVFLVSYPSGSVRMITNDVDNYGGVSLSREGDSLTVQRTSSSRSMWTTAVDGAGEPRQITSRSDSEAIGGVRPAEDGSIVFAAQKDGYRQLWVMAGDGSGRRQITSADGWAFGARLLPGANSVVFTLGTEQDRVLMNHIWRVDLDGGNLVRLSEGERELLTTVSPDGRTMLFRRPDTPNVLWRRPADGGEPSRFLRDTSGGASYSPDGSLLSYSVFREVDGRSRREGVIIPAEGGERIASFLRHGDASDPEWIPGGRALTYIVTTDGVKNIWRQPIDEQEAVQVTRLTEGGVRNHEWSPDGSRIALTRRLGEVQNIWVVDADGRNSREITDFRTGQIFNFDWARDGKSLIFVQGEVRSEVVMIRNVEDPS